MPPLIASPFVKNRLHGSGIVAIHGHLYSQGVGIAVDGRHSQRFALFAIGDETIAICDAPDHLCLVPLLRGAHGPFR